MEFKVLRKTARGNLLLEPAGEGVIQGIEKKTLFAGKKKAAVAFDTVGSVKKPFYLAKPLVEKPGGLVGKVLSAKKA